METVTKRIGGSVTINWYLDDVPVPSFKDSRYPNLDYENFVHDFKERAMERALSQIAEGCWCGELCETVYLANDEEVEVSGWWKVSVSYDSDSDE
jgi:hypothetical protein